MKQKNAMIEDTKWPVLVDLSSRAEVSEPVQDSVLVMNTSNVFYGYSERPIIRN